MSLTEKVEQFGRNHTKVIALSSIVVSVALGLGLSYLTSKYDVLGHLGASLSGRTYDQHKVEVRDRLTRNFMEKYDLNRDGMVTKEEYHQVVGRKVDLRKYSFHFVYGK